LAAPSSPVPIHAEIRAQPTGWIAMAASQVCVHVQQAYSSALMSDARALESAANMPVQGAAIRERHPGRRVRAWEKNCVALGEAACVFDPLHFVDLHAVQVGLVHLLHLFPVHDDYDVERDDYNQNVRSAFERVRTIAWAATGCRRMFSRSGRRRGPSRPVPSWRTRSTPSRHAVKPCITRMRPSPSTTGRRCSSATA
jgi:hypothetical protein